MTPTLSQKIIFWLAWGSISALGAELVSGSYPLPFFTIWGLGVIIPLYLLHSIVLGHLVWSLGRPWFPALFFAGTLFGLYEAYVTKVLWNPPWDSLFMAGGVGIPEIIVLVFWWHPFFAFIMPLLAVESLLTRSRSVIDGLPVFLKELLSSLARRRILVPIAGLCAGTIYGFTAPVPLAALVTVLADGAVLAILVWAARRAGVGQYGFREMLPGRAGIALCWVLLGMLYLGLGAGIRPELIPSVGPQAIIWALYVAGGVGLFLAVRASRRQGIASSDAPPAFSWRAYLWFAAMFAMTSFVSSWILYPVHAWAFLALWVVGGILGIWSLVWSVLAVARSARTP